MNKFIKFFSFIHVFFPVAVFAADWETHGDWNFFSISDACFMDTETSTGTILRISAYQDAPQAASFHDGNWSSAPGSWSDGQSIVHLNFSKADRQSVLAFNINERIVLGDVNISKSLGLLKISLIAESMWNGWVEMNVQGAPSVGRFSANGYTEAAEHFDICAKNLT